MSNTTAKATAGGGITVLHIATRHRRGGARRNLLHRIRLELNAGDCVHVAVGEDSDLSDFGQDVVVHHVPQLRREVRPFSDLTALRQMRRIIRDCAIDAVYTHQSKAGILGRLAAYRVAPAVVHTVHMAPFGPAYSTGGSALFRSAERICARLSDYLVFVGEELEQLFAAARIGGIDQRVVIRSPLDVDAFLGARMHTGRDRAALCERFGLEPGIPVVVAAGLLERRKRFDLILRMLSPALRTDELQFVLAGEGPEEGNLRGLVELERLPNVHFTGYTEALHDLFACSDVFVHASTAEGVPQVAIQAAAAGLPIVATRCEGLSEIPGQGLWVISPNGAELLSSVREALGYRGDPAPPVAFQRWSPDAVSFELENLHARVRDLARQRTRRRSRTRFATDGLHNDGV